ncbi:unannotated protein [freshwater metagenome]|uniref:Unannotated protein n=1 Tax=freshwater metagenome TaxID=449393 RepID=A0A6J6IJV2_9ZZZZ
MFFAGLSPATFGRVLAISEYSLMLSIEYLRHSISPAKSLSAPASSRIFASSATFEIKRAFDSSTEGAGTPAN